VLRTDRQRTSVVQSIRAHAARKPDEVALILLGDGETETARLSWSELDLRCRALAARLTAAGMAGERVLLPLPTSIEYVIGFLGCLYATALPVPIYPPRSGRHAARMDRLIADTTARLALTRSELQAELDATLTRVAGPGGCASWVIDDREPDAEPAWTEPDFDLDATAYLQYTSGSTSDPRGVMVTNRSLLHQFRLQVEGLGLAGEADVHVTWIPLYHDMGLVGGLLQPLHDGASVVLMPPTAFIQRPVRWLRAITTYRGTASYAPNFALELCSDAVDAAARTTLDLSSWHMLAIGGEPVRADTVDRFADTFADCGLRRSALCPGYGMAEATLAIISRRPQEPLTITTVLADELGRGRIVEPAPDSRARTRRLVSGGWAWLDTEIVITDPETRTPQPDGSQGEIWCRGETVTAGYWNHPEETAATFGSHLADGRGPFLRTGDLGVRYGGELHITGRLKDLIVIRGANHYPQDIEYTAGRSRPALAAERAAAFSVDAGGAERLVVLHELDRTWFRSQPPEGPDTADLTGIVTAIRDSVAAAHDLAVDAVALLRPGTLPMTSSGKVRRKEGRRLFLEGGLDTVHVWSVLPVEGTEPAGTAGTAVPDGTVSEPYEEVVGWLRATVARHRGVPADHVDLDTPFGELGLDSLRMVRMSGEIADRFGRRVDPAFLYDHPSVFRLARALTGSDERPEAGPVVVGGQDDPVVVVGMACRFPGADSVEDFWSLLEEGREAIGDVPPGRPAGEAIRVRAGFIGGVDEFDANFFGISRREADGMDPQQRLLLTVAWRALEDAGIAPSSLAGTATGVFVGISTGDYARLEVAAGAPLDAYVGTGTAFSIAANRISYLLDLRGPSVAVDTACSSSLVALHQAVSSLQRGECDLALAGGVNLLLAPDLTEVFTHAGMLSPDGRCKVFDASADGYVRGEGCGVVVLRRVPDAEAANDRVRALVRGTAMNHGGRTSSLTAPNGPSQQAVLQRALAAGRTQPQEVGYVEAHGTGTSLGDPIEMAALTAVYDGPGGPLHVGSVKTNIGHLEAAAGIAGFIKAVLALEHRRVPAHLNFTSLNPQIALDGTRIRIPEQTVDWPGSAPRVAAVSSFGFGGANAHAVLEEAPAVPASTSEPDGEWQLLPISARDETALHRLAAAYVERLEKSPEPFGAVCTAAAERRQHYPHRLAVVARDDPGAVEALLDLAEGFDPATVRRGLAAPRLGEKVAFLFTGQGAQYPGMAAPLYPRREFREALTRCDELVVQELGTSLLPTLLGVGPALDLTRTGYAQPAMFAVDYAAAALWQSCGVQPDAVLGHSLGEYVAACVAGVIDLPDAIRMVVQRGRFTEQLCPPGGVLAVQAGPGLVDELLAEVSAADPAELALAAVNGPYDLAISGADRALTDLQDRWADRGLRMTRLPGTRAFHSGLVRPAAEPFAEVARSMTYRPARIPIVGNLTGERADEAMADPDYWVRQLLEPVRFGPGLGALAAAGCRTFVEAGPHPALTAIGSSVLPDARWLPTQRRSDTDDRRFVLSLAGWYASGGAVDWAGLRAGNAAERSRPARPVPLPEYPLTAQRHWFSVGDLPRRREPGHPLLGAPIDVAGTSEKRFGRTLDADALWYLDQHRVFGGPVLPAAAMVEWALAAAAGIGASRALRDVTFNAPLSASRDDPSALQSVVETLNGTTRIRCFSRPASSRSWTEHLTAVVGDPETLIPGRPDPTGMVQLEADALYASLPPLGLEYGPQLRGVRALWRDGDSVVSRIEVDPPAADGDFTAVVDSALQSAVTLVDVDGTAWLPASVDRVTAAGSAPRSAWAVVRRRDSGATKLALLDVDLVSGEGEPFLALRGLRLAPVDRRAFRRIGSDVRCYEVSWHPAPEAGPVPAGPWLVTGPDLDGVRRWVDELVADGITATAVPWGAAAAEALASASSGGLLIRGATATDAGQADPAEAATCLALDGLEVLRSYLSRHAAAGAQVVVSSAGAAIPTPPGGRIPMTPADLAEGVLTGLAKTVIGEYPQVRCVQVDLDPAADEPPVTRVLARAAGVAGSGHLALRAGTWWEAGLAAEPVTGRADPGICADGTYLVTGGFGALGRQVAHWLAARGARTLLLVGRTVPAGGSAPVEELRAAGVRVETVAGDVADPATLAVLEERLLGLPPLRGIVHTAGTRDDGALENLDPDRVEGVLDPKVRGGWLVHQLAQRHEPELVVLFSSLASVTGSAGQANYVLANTFLDGLATYRRQRGLPALSVGWGPWAGAGMAAGLEGTFARAGLRALDADEALDALAGVLPRSTAHVAVAAVDWGQHSAAVSGRQDYSLLTGLLGAAAPETASSAAPAPAPAALPSAAELAVAVVQEADHGRELVESYVCDRVASLLGWSRTQRVEMRPTVAQLRLSELGIDSLMAVTLRNQFLRDLATDFPPQYLLGDHTLGDVVERAIQQLTVKQMMTVDAAAHGDEDLEILTL
jgi:phthiocerol/phenolphthiocerol synthesis type-I polyketide synthase C